MEEIPLNRFNGEEEDEYDDLGQKKDSTLKRKWDMFRDIPPKTESGSQGKFEFIDWSVRILKILSYIFTFAMVLIGGVVAKAGILLITSQLNKTVKAEACLDARQEFTAMFTPPPEQKVLWTWVLLIIVCIPEFGTFVRSARISFFKNNSWPQFLDFVFIAFMETCQAIGIAILIFEVLPQLDAIRGAMLTNAVCFIPAVVQLLSRDIGQPAGMINVCADGLAVVFQFTALIVWPLYEQSARLGMIAPALFLISCGWWLNYVPVTKPKGFLSGFMQILWGVKERFGENQLYLPYIFISVWKMIVMFLAMLVILSAQGTNLTEFFNQSEAAFSVQNFTGPMTKMVSADTLAVYDDVPVLFQSGEYDWLYVTIVVTAGSYVCYIFSKFACKILIQEIGMSLANVLVVPGTIALLVIFDKEQTCYVCFSQYFLPPYIFWNIDLDGNFIGDRLAWIWLFWLVSQVWVTFHIWYPQCERLARTEKLFVLPMYSAVVPDQSICLNRTIYEEMFEEEVADAESDDSVPNVIACATMWHESSEEMLEMFKSILRMDLDQAAHEAAKLTFNTATARNNYYKFETQIFFDDAFSRIKLTDEERKNKCKPKFQVNSYVKDMMVSLPQAVRHVYHSNKVKIADPVVNPTPYGGRMTYMLPGGTTLTVHLKDKQKIRHRKRWSQCMYMYYLLGYKLMNRDDLSAERKDLMAKNTFLLALDGDIDFQPKAVQLLVDLMKKNDNLGAACGRIHPVGSGLMAWYQIFEYAIGHWLQKATEHMIGCVLCSPGCFSLFRGRALMDDNVMKTYTKDCEAARHYVQYDQGEDRWLCTLLLQQGHRVEYSAASDAYTHCPENFNEFYNQRRRWVPSTMANIMDLLGSYKRTIAVNSNISLPYIMYQTMLLGGTILGPGTIFLMLVGAFVAAFKIDNWSAFYYNLIPIIAFIAICLFLKPDVQLMFALVISTVYGLIMMAVLVGILIEIQEDGPLAPSTLFLFIVAGEIIIAGLVHPQEVYCLPSGTIYYVTIPSMYLLLIIYSVCNLNVVSWGTRETVEEKVETEEERKKREEMEAKKTDNPILAFLENFSGGKGKEKGSLDLSVSNLFRCMCCTQPADFDEKEHLIRIGESLVGVNDKLDAMTRYTPGFNQSVLGSRRGSEFARSRVSGHETPTEAIVPEKLELLEIVERDELINPYWLDVLEEETKSQGSVVTIKMLPTVETTFWQELIERYLKPIDEKPEKQKEIAKDLRELRDKNILAFFMLNALFVTVVFLLQLNKDTIYINWPLGVKSNITYDPTDQDVIITQHFLELEPIGLVFVLFFAIILLIQFTGMFFHRFETLCHVLSTTSIFNTGDSLLSIDRFIDSCKEGISQDDKAPDSVMAPRTSQVSNRRQTIKLLEAEYEEKKPQSVNVQQRLSMAMGMKVDDVVAHEEKKADKRNSRYNRMSYGGVGRNSMAPRRMTMGQSNHAFSSISEE